MRRKKLAMELEKLAVDSFATTAGDEARGTVLANAGDCTCAASCPCPSAPYWCADAYETLISCGYTANRSCMTPPGD